LHSYETKNEELGLPSLYWIPKLNKKSLKIQMYQREVIRIRKSKKDRQHNGEKDKQRSTNHTHKTKDRVTRNPLQTGGELMWFVRVNSSCATSGTRCVNVVTNSVISHE